MEKGGQDGSGGSERSAPAPGQDEPGSETERFQAVTELRNNEAVTGESGVPRRQRGHELRRQLSSLDEFC